MNFWLLMIIVDTVMVALLGGCVARLDKQCWDLLGVIKGMSEHITKLEEKVGLVHSDIQK